MNDRFWKWLARVDVRIVALVMISVCAAVSAGAILHIGFAGWGDSGSIEGWASPSEDAPIDPDSAVTPDRVSSQHLPSPFSSEYLKSYLETLADVGNPERPAPVFEPEPERAPTLSEPARIVRLIYHGLMERPDKTEMALVENSGSGTMKFYGVGEKLDVFTVKKFDSRLLMLAGGEDRTWKLPVNHLARIEVHDP